VLDGVIINMILGAGIGGLLDAYHIHSGLSDEFNDCIMNSLEALATLREKEMDTDGVRVKKMSLYPEGRRKSPLKKQAMRRVFNRSMTSGFTPDIHAELGGLFEIQDTLARIDERHEKTVSSQQKKDDSRRHWRKLA
jgi:hypothetical protein